MVHGGDVKVLTHTQPNHWQHTPLTITTLAHYVGVTHERGVSESVTWCHMVKAPLFDPDASLSSEHHLSFCSAALCKARGFKRPNGRIKRRMEA